MKAMTPVPEAQHVPVSALMNREVISVRSDVSVDSAVETMLTQGLSRMPVVDEKGSLIGIFSKTDVVADQHVRGDTHEEERPGRGMHIHEEGPLVGEVMSRSPITVTESAAVAKASELMAVYKLHALPVLSEQGALVGILSSTDVLEWVAGLS